jgi:hypothetical protein
MGTMKLTAVDRTPHNRLKEGIRKALGPLAAAGSIAIAGTSVNAAFAQTPPQIEKSISNRSTITLQKKQSNFPAVHTLSKIMQASVDDSIENVLLNWPFGEYLTPVLDPWQRNLNNDEINLSGWLSTYGQNKNIRKDTTFITRVYQKLTAIEDTSNVKNCWNICMAEVCFYNTTLFNKPQFSGLVSLDSSTATRMVSLDSATAALLVGRGVDTTDGITAPGTRTMIMLYEIARQHKGVPIAKTLFDDYNITSIGDYPQDVVEHLYFDRGRVTGKPLMFMAFTKVPKGKNFGMALYEFNCAIPAGSGGFNVYIKTANYRNFDIRICEPRTDLNTTGVVDTSMASLMTRISTELGGQKFKFMILCSHGNAAGIQFLSTGNVDALKPVKPLISDRCDVVFFSCSAAGDIIPPFNNLAEFTAKTLAARSFGSVGESDLYDIEFTADNTEVQSVVYSAGTVATKVYDYRLPVSISSEITPGVITIASMNLVRKNGNTFVIHSPGASKCAIYDLQGRTIDEFLETKSGNFVWDAAKMAAGTYIAHSVMKDGKASSLKIGITRQ